MVPGGFSANATEVEQEGLRLPPVKLFKRGRARRRDPVDHPVEHPHRRPAHRRHQGPGRGARDRRAAPDRAARPLRRATRSTPRSPSCGRARRARCARRSRRSPTASTAARPSSTPTASSTSRCGSRCGSRSGRARRSDLRHFAALRRRAGADEQRASRRPSRRSTSRSSTSSPTCRSTPARSSRCTIVEPEGTFLYAHYPRPVSGCAAEVSQRIAEAVFAALGRRSRTSCSAAPAGTSGNLARRRLRPGDEPRLRDVRDLGRRLRRQRRTATASPTAARPSASRRRRRSR